MDPLQILHYQNIHSYRYSAQLKKKIMPPTSYVKLEKQLAYLFMYLPSTDLRNR